MLGKRLRILQTKDKSEEKGFNVVDTYAIDASAVREMHFRYLVVPKSEKDSKEGQTQIDIDKLSSREKPVLKFTFADGSSKEFDMAIPTSFLLYEGDKEICKTSKLQELERAFFGVSPKPDKAQSSE